MPFYLKLCCFSLATLRCNIRQWADTRTALLSAFIWCIYPSGLRLVLQVSGDLIATACVTFGIYFVLRARTSRSKVDWLMVGLCLGFGVMSRSAVLAIVAVVLAILFFDRWRGWRNLMDKERILMVRSNFDGFRKMR